MLFLRSPDPIHYDVVLAAYYGVISTFTFNNTGYKTAKLCSLGGTSTYWRLLLYGDNTLIATAYSTQGPVTVDVSAYHTLKVSAPEVGNTFQGWLELS